MVALRVAIDHARTEKEALVLELLVERRLPRPERSDAEDRRVAIAVRPFPQVESDRLAAPRERMAEIEPASRPHGVRRGWHHRGRLLGREHFVVSAHARSLRGQLLHEELELIAEWAVQADIPERAARGLHSLLELILAQGCDRDRERRSQKRRAPACLQVSEQVARLMRALDAQIGRSLIALGLRAIDLVGVLDPFARDTNRELVG